MNFTLTNFWRFWYHKKAHVFFLITIAISQLKMFHSEDENVPGYGNHNQAYTQ